MMKRNLLFSALLFGCLQPSGEPLPPATTSPVRLLEVREVRYRGFGTIKPERKTGAVDPAREPRLTVVVEVQGQAAAAAVKYGFIEIAKAEDDRGTLLEPRTGIGLDNHPHDRFIEVDRDSMFYWDDAAPKDKLRINLHFEPLARGAKKLIILSGTMKLLTIQEQKEVVVADILNSQGDTLENDVLKSAGLEIKVARVDPRTKSITLEIAGARDSLVGLALVDSDGNNIEVATLSAQSDISTGPILAMTLQPWAAVPPDAQLELTVGFGQQTVEVPFHFSNVLLP